MSNSDHDLADIEYGVRVYDALGGDLSGSTVTRQPSLVMAEDYVASLARLNSTRSTYGIRGELVHRTGPQGEWLPLSSEEAEQIKQEAWAGLDDAMAPVIAAGLAQLAEQQRGVIRPKPTGGGAS